MYAIHYFAPLFVSLTTLKCISLATSASFQHNNVYEKTFRVWHVCVWHGLTSRKSVDHYPFGISLFC